MTHRRQWAEILVLVLAILFTAVALARVISFFFPQAFTDWKMVFYSRRLGQLLKGATMLVLCLAASAADGAAEIDFLREVFPILETRCLPCHGADRQEGDLRLDRKDFVLQGSTLSLKKRNLRRTDVL